MKQSFRPAALMTVLVMLALLVGCLTLATAADTAALTVGVGNLDFSESNVTLAGGVYTKEYDGTADATGIKQAADVALEGVAEGDEVTLNVTAAYFTDANGNQVANAGEATTLCIELALAGEDAAAYTVNSVIKLPATITAKTLYWDGSATATAPYQPDSTDYVDLPLTLPGLVDANGTAVTDVKVVGADQQKISVKSLHGADVKTEISVQIEAAKEGVLLANYRVLPLTVEVDVTPLLITDVQISGNTFVYGSDEATAITATAKVNGIDVPLAIVYPTGYGSVGVHTVTVKTLDAGFAFDVQNEFRVEITPFVYQVGMDSATVVDRDDSFYALTVKGLTAELPEEILSAITYTYTKDGVTLEKVTDWGVYTVVADLSGVKNYAFTDASGAKVETLTATLAVNRVSLPAGTESEPYRLIVVGANGVDAGMTASSTVPATLDRKAIRGMREYRAYTLTVAGSTGAYSVLIEADKAFYNEKFVLNAGNVYLYNDETGKAERMYDPAATSVAGAVTVEYVDGFYRISGLQGDATYTFIVSPEYDPPFWISAPGIALIVLLILALLVLMFFIGIYLRRAQAEKNQVLVVDTDGNVPPVKARPVSDTVDVDKVLEENLEAVEEALDEAMADEAADVTEETEAAVEEAIEELLEETSAIVLEEAAEETPVEEEAVEEAAEEAVEEAAEEAEGLNESADATGAVAIMAEDELTPENLRRAIDAIVDDALHATAVLPAIEEAPAGVAEQDAEVGEDAEVCAMIADSVAVAFEHFTVDGVAPVALEGTTADIINASVTVAAKNHMPQDWSVELFDTVISAVTEELVARLIKEEPVEEPVAEEAPVEEAPAEEAPAEEPVVETMASAEDSDEDDDNDDDDNDDNDNDDGDSFMSFASAQDFIDIAADPDAYAELLEREKRGEIRIVTRYRKSYMSRLVQSQGNVQNYYSILKNALLSHKGVKSRQSWNYEAFNKGRAHLAKMNAKTKTLYLYLALDPEELKDTKYGIVDVSSKKKYATVPVLMKIKGDRKFKYALELVNKLCEEKMELAKLDLPETDYRMDHMTTEELVEKGYVKKLVAGIPVEEPEQTVADDAAVEAPEAPAANEAADVTFVAPSDDAAVTAAAETLANEESTEETTEA